MMDFDAKRHEYTVDGRAVPCVSDLVAVFGKEIETGDELETALEVAADRGVTCHKVLELLLKGEEPEYPSVYEPYVEGIRMLLSEHEILPLAIETPLYSACGDYAGTPDLLCVMDGRLALLDYKFVSQVAKTKVKAQLNAYRLAYEERGVYPEVLYAVQFLKDGTYRLYEVPMDDEEVQVALHIYRLKNKKHPRGVIV